jgi:hypothetical protein
LGKRLRERLRARRPDIVVLRPDRLQSERPASVVPGVHGGGGDGGGHFLRALVPQASVGDGPERLARAASAQKIHRDGAVQRARRDCERRHHGRFLFVFTSFTRSFFRAFLEPRV